MRFCEHLLFFIGQICYGSTLIICINSKFRKILNGELITKNKFGNLDVSLQTKFIVHGFLHNGLKDYMIEIKNTLLSTANINVVVVDWSKGITCKAIYYKQSF